MKAQLSTREISLIAICIAILAITSQISIPMPYGVPMTLQTLVIPAIAIFLGTKNSFIVVILYLFLGALGLPVFAGFSGSIASFFRPTSGFLLSFPILAITTGIGAESDKKWQLLLGIIMGTILNYFCGTLLFMLITTSTLHAALAVCVTPFIPTTILKIIIAYLFGLKVKPLANHYQKKSV